MLGDLHGAAQASKTPTWKLAKLLRRHLYILLIQTGVGKHHLRGLGGLTLHSSVLHGLYLSVFSAKFAPYGSLCPHGMN